MQLLRPIVISVFLYAASIQAQDVTYLQRWKVKQGESEVLSIKIYEHKLKLEFGSRTLEARRELKNGKRKYDEGEATNHEIKFGDDGDFKLRTAQGELLWKAKFKAGRISISANEEMLDPFELGSDTTSNRVKVTRATRDIARVKFYPEEKEQKLKSVPENKTLFTMKSTALSPMLGILACEAIPKTERFVLAAELAMREFETKE